MVRRRANAVIVDVKAVCGAVAPIRWVGSPLAKPPRASTWRTSQLNNVEQARCSIVNAFGVVEKERVGLRFSSVLICYDNEYPHPIRLIRGIFWSCMKTHSFRPP